MINDIILWNVFDELRRTLVEGLDLYRANKFEIFVVKRLKLSIKNGEFSSALIGFRMPYLFFFFAFKTLEFSSMLSEYDPLSLNVILLGCCVTFCIDNLITFKNRVTRFLRPKLRNQSTKLMIPSLH